MPNLFTDVAMSDAEARAFDERALEISTIYVRIALWGLTVGFVAFWPLDRWFVVDQHQSAVDAMTRFRIAVIVSLVCLGVAAWTKPLATRPAVVLIMLAGVLSANAAFSLGPLFDLRSGAIDLALLLPFGLTPLSVPLARRILLTVIVTSTWVAALLIGSDPSFEGGLVHLVTLSSMGLIAVASGQVIRNAARHSFLVGRQLQRSGEELEDRVRERREQLHRAYDGITAKREAERARLGRELHDATGQTLTGLRLELGLARLAPTDGAPSAGGDLASLAEPLDALFESLRTVLMRLRPTVLDDLGLPAALEWLAFHEGHRTGAVIHHRIDEAAAAVDPDTAMGLFRAVESALDALLAPAPERVSFRLHHDLEGVSFSAEAVADAPDLSAIAAQKQSLMFLTERARALRGRLEVGRSAAGQPANRITLTLTLPVAPVGDLA